MKKSTKKIYDQHIQLLLVGRSNQKKKQGPPQAPAIQVQSPHVYRSMMDGGIQLTDPTFLSLSIQLTGSGSETLGMW